MHTVMGVSATDMGMNAADDARKEKLGETLQHVIDMRIAREYAMATSGGDDEMA